MTDPFPQLPAALVQFESDQYSESNRWAQGYSDCSSFIGKGMKALGKDQGDSTTLTYLASTDWVTIPKSEAGAGDICVNGQHMACMTSNNTAVGQQNPRRNVVHDSVDNIMYGTGPYIIRRYKDAANVTGISNASFNVSPTGQSDIFSFPEGVINFFEEITKPEFIWRLLMILGGAIILGFSIYTIGKS